jgi:hypothetical protein
MSPQGIRADLHYGDGAEVMGMSDEGEAVEEVNGRRCPKCGAMIEYELISKFRILSV